MPEQVKTDEVVVKKTDEGTVDPSGLMLPSQLKQEAMEIAEPGEERPAEDAQWDVWKGDDPFNTDEKDMATLAEAGRLGELEPTKEGANINWDDMAKTDPRLQSQPPPAVEMAGRVVEVSQEELERQKAQVTAVEEENRKAFQSSMDRLNETIEKLATVRTAEVAAATQEPEKAPKDFMVAGAEFDSEEAHIPDTESFAAQQKWDAHQRKIEIQQGVDDAMAKRDAADQVKRDAAVLQKIQASVPEAQFNDFVKTISGVSPEDGRRLSLVEHWNAYYQPIAAAQKIREQALGGSIENANRVDSVMPQASVAEKTKQDDALRAAVDSIERTFGPDREPIF